MDHFYGCQVNEGILRDSAKPEEIPGIWGGIFRFRERTAKGVAAVNTVEARPQALSL